MKKHLVLNIIIGILSVVLAAGIVQLIFVKIFFGVSNNYKTDNSMLYYELQQGWYAEFVRDCYCNKYCGITEETKPEYTDYIEFAKYYETAAKYRVYSEMGYEDRAKEALSQMDEAKAKMTELSALTDKVDKMLQCR